jgi:alpha,alpha-trehalose phosphorylase
MTIPYDSELGVHQQAEGFTRHQAWDFASTKKSQYPLMRHFHYFDLYRKQVVKQADLVLAMHRHPQAFTAEQKAANFAYYERLTVRDSSLSAITQSVIAAEVGQLELAHDYLAETALIDLADTEHDVRDGLHLASLAGAWTAAVAGLGGLRGQDGTLTFAPRLPAAIPRLAFTISTRGQPLHTEITAAAATYTLAAGLPIQIRHHGQPVTLQAGQPLTLPIHAFCRVTRLAQPRGREPARRAARSR